MEEAEGAVVGIVPFVRDNVGEGLGVELGVTVAVAVAVAVGEGVGEEVEASCRDIILNNALRVRTRSKTAARDAIAVVRRGMRDGGCTRA